VDTADTSSRDIPDLDDDSLDALTRGIAGGVETAIELVELNDLYSLTRVISTLSRREARVTLLAMTIWYRRALGLGIEVGGPAET
jgi:hypothetical protein